MYTCCFIVIYVTKKNDVTFEVWCISHDIRKLFTRSLNCTQRSFNLYTLFHRRVGSSALVQDLHINGISIYMVRVFLEWFIRKYINPAVWIITLSSLRGKRIAWILNASGNHDIITFCYVYKMISDGILALGGLKRQNQTGSIISPVCQAGLGITGVIISIVNFNEYIHLFQLVWHGWCWFAIKSLYIANLPLGLDDPLNQNGPVCECCHQYQSVH